MRISTTQYFGMNVQTMDDQQSTLAQLYQQLSSGVSLATPSDNPVGAAQAVQLSMQGATLSQYADNQNTALSYLQAEDSSLTSVSNVLTAITTQLVHAGDGSLNDANRGSIATALQGLRNQLVGLANGADPSGNYLYGGYQATTAPFSVGSSGAVQYNGDNGVQNVQITNTRNIAVADTGQSVFLSTSLAGSSSVTGGSLSNTGTGAIGGVTTNNTTDPTNQDKFTISFTSATTYTVTDNTTSSTSAPQTYTAGQPITLGGGGQSVTISGAPNAGDNFTVAPAARSADVFANLDSVIAALQKPVSGASDQTNLTNALNTALIQFHNTLNNVTTVQTSVGGREQEVQALQSITQSNNLQTQSNLADLTQTDLTSVISKYTMTQFSLQAAQQGFSMIQKLSLFNYIGN
ncbi:flagellar hook-associated protein FlgL [Paraburkholderia hospita]|uniref:flagellar hook-associated protein FlgL n=1 Tax=Paraburkholderia hospita TaxID=169430 RepID=UPI000271AE99|nr:flagellar hook-associated protein FlgL [Paraburkholderia hospita]EUC21342.1 flagellar hook-associated protein 3 [Burkholderia sp. BT03]SKC94779.1 flagellar hook-associated protein 3 [Paraburkholderia hospita]